MSEPPLHYELIQTRGLRFEVATAGEGERLALLLHGFPECAHSFRRQIPLLAALGYRVWAPNMRGYGRSDRPGGVQAYAIDRLEQDVTDLIDASGAKSVVLLGHDWGGMVAWNYAIYGTRPIERLIALNCPHPARFLASLRTLEQLRHSWYIGLFQLPWLPEFLIGRDHARRVDDIVRGTAVHPEQISDLDIDALRDNASIPGALTAMINYYRAAARAALLEPFLFARTPNRPPRLFARARHRASRLFARAHRASRREGATIRVPTLMVWGEQDYYVSKQVSRGTERYVSDLTVRYIPDASHWVHQDAPDAVNRELTAWLAGPKPEQLRASDVASNL